MGEAGKYQLRQVASMIKASITATGLYAIALLLSAPSAQAQTADQYNRASQAIQICSSAMGATIPECAKLRGTYGAPTLGGGGGGLGALSGLGSLGGFKGMGSAGKAAGIANLLGSAMSQARSAAPAQAAAAPVANTAMIQQAITDCVRNAAGNNAMIQGCLAIATGGANVPPAAR